MRTARPTRRTALPSVVLPVPTRITNADMMGTLRNRPQPFLAPSRREFTGIIAPAPPIDVSRYTSIAPSR